MIGEEVPSRRPTGSAIAIDVMPRAAASSDGAEAHSLLQLAVSKITVATASSVADASGTGGTDLGHIAPTGTMQLAGPMQPTFQADRGPSLGQILAEHGHLESFTNDRCIYVASFYLDPLRWTFCPFTRIVCIRDSVSSWRNDLIRAWQDVADPTGGTAIFVVHPSPIQTQDQSIIRAFVIVVQNLREQDRATLVTTQTQGVCTHVAWILPPQTDKVQLLQSIGLAGICVGPSRTADCMSRQGWTPIVEGEQCPLANGNGLHVDILPRIVQAHQSTVLRTPDPPVICLYDTLDCRPQKYALFVLVTDSIKSLGAIHMDLIQRCLLRNPAWKAVRWTDGRQQENVLLFDTASIGRAVFIPRASEFNDAATPFMQPSVSS